MSFDLDCDFDLASKLAILRRAVAALPTDVPGHLNRSRDDLAHLAELAELLLCQCSSNEQRSAFAVVRTSLLRRPPTRSLLEHVRAELHACLTEASASLAALEIEDAERPPALALRSLLSDFRSALLPDSAATHPWPLAVAAAELRLLLLHPVVHRAPASERTQLLTLGTKTERFCSGDMTSVESDVLLSELCATIDRVLSRLSQRAEVRRHDQRVLVDLTRLLRARARDLPLALSMADGLSALRGRDRDLDALIAWLPLDPVPTLGLLATRIQSLSSLDLAS